MRNVLVGSYLHLIQCFCFMKDKNVLNIFSMLVRPGCGIGYAFVIFCGVGR